MRIAQIAPLFESVPPKRYGGVERVVAYLTDELVHQGHEVTLFASGDSRTEAELVPCCGKSIREHEAWVDPLAFHALQLHQVFAREFDIIHFHIEYLALPFISITGCKSIVTLHGPLMDNVELFRVFGGLPFVSISDAQRAPFPHLNWQGTIYHGLPYDLYRFHSKPEKYIAFLGRIAPEKRCDRAIALAKATGIPLKIAAKIDPYDRAYFEAHIRPLLDHPLVEFIGEIGESEKDDFLGNALALIFPIDWPEPFGLVMIEALACGTPVIAWRRGSAPEIIEDGITGRIVENLESAIEAVREIDRIDRARCREAFQERSTASRMAAEYAQVYATILSAPRRTRIKRRVQKQAPR